MKLNLEKEFFNFIYERHLIWYKRFILKQEAPWTKDEILKKYKIINVYRELDKCTIYIIEKLREIKERDKIFINIVFYRFFNRVDLYEELKIEPFEKINFKIKNEIIKELNNTKLKGLPIFNNAYLISSGSKGEKKHISIIENLSKINISQIISEIDAAENPRKSLEAIQKIPMIGPFLACEIWTDLSYLSFFKQKWNDNDFVNIGPGAKWGLEIIYGKKMKKDELENALNKLWKSQNEYLLDINKNPTWKEIALKNASSNYPYLSITNIEGSLCEFRKYWNIKNGKGRRKYFKPYTKTI